MQRHAGGTGLILLSVIRDFAAALLGFEVRCSAIVSRKGVNAAVFVALFGSWATAAAQVTVLNASRSGEATVQVEQSTALTVPPFFLFQDTVTSNDSFSSSAAGSFSDVASAALNPNRRAAAAQVNTTPGDGHTFGSLRVETISGGAWPTLNRSFAAGSTLYDVTFRLATAYDFNFYGGVQIDEQAVGDADAEMFLWSFATSSHVAGTHVVAESGISLFETGGVLAAGDYRLFMSVAAHSASGSSVFMGAPSTLSAVTLSYNFDLSAAPVTPIPEPETWALLLAGLGLLGVWGRRRAS